MRLCGNAGLFSVLVTCLINVHRSFQLAKQRFRALAEKGVCGMISCMDLNNYFCILSATGRSAIATIWVRGNQLESLVTHHFRSATNLTFSRMKVGQIAFGNWGRCSENSSPQHSGIANNDPSSEGEELVITRTDEDSIEIHCHGGVGARTLITEDLINSGFEELQWESWEQDRTPNLVEAESLKALRLAKTETTAGVLLYQYNGALERAIQHLLDQVKSNQFESAMFLTKELLANAELGCRLTSPFNISVIGRPNVGKSSLLNRLIGFERAIVFDVPGTTRDIVSEESAIGGWPVVISDTAGIRETDHEIESEGVRRAMQSVDQSDLAIFVVDQSQMITDDDVELFRSLRNPIVVGNKSDLEPQFDFELFTKMAPSTVEIRSTTETVIRTSATSGDGVSELLKRIEERLIPIEFNIDDPVPFTKRQQSLLNDILEYLSAADGNAAIESLDELVGRKNEC